MNLDIAARIIARAVAAELLRDHAEDKWEDHPLVGEHDWEEVEAEVEELLTEISPTTEQYESAYKWLADRAGGSA